MKLEDLKRNNVTFLSFGFVSNSDNSAISEEGTKKNTAKRKYLFS